MAGDSMPTTHWTMVLQATSPSDPQARASLEQLCERYWRPVFAYLCRRGHDPDDALDFTQGFFERVLEPNFLGGVDRSKGTFRSFLLIALRRHVNDERKMANAKKRGRGIDFVPLDATDAVLSIEASSNLSPDEAFDRQWQVEQLEQAKARVKARMIKNDRAERYRALHHLLTEKPEPGEYEKLAPQLGLTEKATRLTVDRMRRMLEQELRAVVSEETHASA